MTKKPIGIIGGSGLYKMDGVKITEEREIKTPFGMPSDAIILGTLDGTDIAFLPRHGRGHRIPANELNFRANIYAMKMLGVENIISVSAVGSMKEEIKPGHLVIIDQFFDRTKGRTDTFFGDGIAVHASFADPICPHLRKAAVKAAQSAGVTVHDGGTYICIEGPMFSSRAESKIYRQWGVDVIGMTNYQEAKLAREAEICYATIALATDYDCWHVGEENVDVAMVVKTLHENVIRAQETIRKLLPTLSNEDCPCRHSLEGAIMSDRKVISEEAKKRLALLIGKYLK